MENQLPHPQHAIPSEGSSINRREFLNLAWLASLGVVAVTAGGATFFFALPRFGEGEFGGQFSIPVTDLPRAEDSPAGFPSGRFWLSRTQEGVAAFYMVCTHLGCLYSWLDEGGYFRCPCHGSEFRKDGSWQHGPAPRSLDRFVLRTIDPDTGEVLAQTDPETLAPLPVPAGENLIIAVDTSELLRGPRK